VPFDWHTSGTQAPERLLPLEPYAKEERANRSESTRLARVEFIRLIPQLKPECLAELWSSVFIEFVYLVSRTFKDTLIQPTVDAETGEEIFSYLLVERYFHIRRDGLLNKSVGDLLCFTFSRYHAIDRITIEKVFPSFEAVRKIEFSEILIERLTCWSSKWNLDANWCLDQAVLTLRNLLTSDRFKWAFVHNVRSLDFIWRDAVVDATANTKESLGMVAVLSQTMNALRTEESESLRFAWYWAAQEITDALLWSRYELSIKVHGNKGDPELFKFKWRDIDIVRPGYNQIKETQSEYRQRLELEFRTLQNERERLALTKISKGDDKSGYTEDLGFGLLQKFREKIDKHIKDVLKKTSRRAKGLVPTRKRPHLLRNLRWTIDYQLYPGKTLKELAGDRLDKTTVKRAIDDSLALLGLTKRIDAKQGRKRGSRNKYYDPARK
jgi:hypothetical protein